MGKTKKERRRLQIGVMGSAADTKYSADLSSLAENLGKAIALSGATLVFGAEKDTDSLSASAARGAQAKGGLTLGVTYGKGLESFQEADVLIATGLERGGGREFSLVLSCDVIIALSGGSGTLTEIAIAYQAGIPTIVLAESGGWSERLAGQFLDSRERQKVCAARTPKEAVSLALKLGRF